MKLHVPKAAKKNCSKCAYETLPHACPINRGYAQRMISGYEEDLKKASYTAKQVSNPEDSLHACAKNANMISGVNCNPDPYEAEYNFRMTHNDWHDKTIKTYAIVVTQTFPKDITDAHMVNGLGQTLAASIAIGHEAAVYTHCSDDCILYNYIVINNVSADTGRVVTISALRNAKELLLDGKY